jgi:hypothetical protein
MVDKVIAKVVDVIRNTPAWEIDIKGYTVRPLEDRGRTEIELLAKICNETPYLFVLVNNETHHIEFHSRTGAGDCRLAGYRQHRGMRPHRPFAEELYCWMRYN